MMSEEIYRALLIAFFSIQSSMLAFLPYVGKVLLALHLCWLYAFTSFEYALINQSINQFNVIVMQSIHTSPSTHSIHIMSEMAD